MLVKGAPGHKLTYAYHHLMIIIVQTLSEDIELIKMPVRYNLSSV